MVARIMQRVLLMAPPMAKPPDKNQEIYAKIPKVGSSPRRSLNRSMTRTIQPKTMCPNPTHVAAYGLEPLAVTSVIL